MSDVERKQVLVQNTALKGYDVTEKQLLNEWPRGAYTTARTVGLDKILEFELHVGRLVESARLMIEADKATVPDALTDAAMFRPYLVRSVASALSHFHNKWPECGTERRITCLLCWGQDAEAPGDDWPPAMQIFSHVHLLPDRPKPPIRVDIRGAPRSNAKAKDTQWVKDRKILEATQGSDVNEILLKDEDGYILEGCQTNFFAVLNGRLYTAGEGVLEGSIRRIVLEECQRADIPVVLEPPNVKDMAQWEGAFISSTSRLALPIDVIHWPQEAGDAQIREFGSQPLTDRIVQLVMEKLDQDSVHIEGAPDVAMRR
jgi:thiol oxidase|mmetsp:Transcript_91745/g.153758  ORF Transcript_91745/g.153758 Transcript_91745/m.153758 type:complete len:316 (-) Transcript_91745:1255-2202(-)